MPIPSYNYSMELSEDLSLDYHDRDILDELYPINTKYFLDGDDLPAGRYRVYYKSGAVQYNSDTLWNVNKQPYASHISFPTTTFTNDLIGSGYDTRKVCYFTDTANEFEVGFVVCYSDGKELCTGNHTGYASDALCVAGNLAISSDYTEVEHTGGPIGIYFHSTSPDISSSSSYSPTYAVASGTHGQPKFILVRTDDPGDYSCGDTINITHQSTKRIHIKRPGDGTFSCSISLTNPLNVNGKVRITTEDDQVITDVGGGWRDIDVVGLHEWSTAIILDASTSGYTLADENLTIEFVRGDGLPIETILGWTFSVSCPDQPDVIEPSDPSEITAIQLSNLVPVSWTGVSNGVNGIVYGYDVYLKEVTGDAPWAFTDDDIISTVSPLTTDYILITQAGKKYGWGIRTVISNNVSGIVTPDSAITISGVAISDYYIRIEPVNKIDLDPINNKIENRVKLQWVQESNDINKFKIWRGLAYYNGENSIFDWIPIAEWDKTIDVSDYNMVVDLSKDSSDSYIFSYSGVITPTLSTQSFSGLTTEEIRNIQLNLDHYELWFKIEALSDKMIKGDLKYIVLGSRSGIFNAVYFTTIPNPSTEGSISCISTKTQFLDYLVNDPVYPSESPIKQELELIWATKKPHAEITGWNDVSRTAMDIKSVNYGREISAWTTCRSGACGRFNLKTGQLQQSFNNFDYGSGVNFGYKPRGTVLDSVSGDCFVAGGDDDGSSNTRIAHLFYKECGRINCTVTGGSITAVSIDFSGVGGYTDGSYTQSILCGTGGIINYVISGNVISSVSINTPGSGYTDGTRKVSINYPLVDLSISDSSKFVALTPPVTRTYGSTMDKFGRLWYVSNFGYVICLDHLSTGGQVYYTSPNNGSNSGYGICTDFYGNVWVTGWLDGAIYIFKINSDTGVVTYQRIVTDTTIYHGGLCADIPATDGTYNIWTGWYLNSWVCKYKFQHYDDGAGNHTVSYISGSYIDVSTLIGASPNFIHGTAFTSENDIIATSYGLPFVLKIYQKENTTNWPNGGLFRYNDKQLTGVDKVTVTGSRYNIAPLGVRYEDDMQHPMWHECYDNYDTNFSYTLSQLSRYISWKRLAGFTSATDSFGETLTDLGSSSNWRLDYPLRMFPHYGGTAGAVSDNPSYPGICYGPGYYITCSIVSGYSVARFAYSANARLVENPTDYGVDLSSWALYVYSDFIGGVGLFSSGNYPVAHSTEKFPPTIGNTIK